MAPMLGLSLGMGLGSGSVGGTILGGIGGLALGGAAGVGLLGGAGASIFASGGALAGLGGMAALLTNPFTIAAGGALLIGAYFLSRNARRKKEEKIRTQHINDALAQLDQILKDVNSHQMSGSEGLRAAEAVKASYIENVNQLKDSKTRRIAMNEVNQRINPRIDQIRSAATNAANDNRRFNNLMPEFATGGLVMGQLGAAQLVVAHGGELIVNSRQQTPEVLSALRDAGVPNVASVAGANRSASNRNDALHVELSLGTQTQNQLFVNGAKSDKGYTIIVEQTNKGKAERRTSF
jgi:hypothetical protein